MGDNIYIGRMVHLPKGRHYLIDLFECNAAILDDQAFIMETLLAAAELAGTQILHHYFHQFEPVGITGSVVIAESHINIHTWPEHNFAAVDVFTCGDTAFPKVATEYLSEKLQSKRTTVNDYERGFVKK